MRTLVHLSDVHFGRVDEAVVTAIIPVVCSLEPDIVVVSGDLTQRAKPEEFRAARRFLDALPTPQIVVPGNHDVPLYNVFQRFGSPLSKYRRFISKDLEPFYCDDEIAVAGINTARSLTFKDGRINQDQMQRLHDRLAPLDDRMTKIVVTHHPFELPEGVDARNLVGRAAQAMDVFLRRRAAGGPPAYQPHRRHGDALSGPWPRGARGAGRHRHVHAWTRRNQFVQPDPLRSRAARNRPLVLGA